MSQLNTDEIQPISVEDYTKEDGILFRYVLSKKEELAIADIIYTVLYGTSAVAKGEFKFFTSEESCKYALQTIRELVPNLVAALDKYFSSIGKTKHFIRLSTLSPKDAYPVLKYNKFHHQLKQIAYEDRHEEESEPMISASELHEELQFLCVSNTDDCLRLLTHSYRTFIDLSSGVKENNAVLLLPWKGDDFWYESETRVCVKNGRVRAMSEYYTDVQGGYANVPSLTTTDAVSIYGQRIIAFVEQLVTFSATPKTIIADVALSKSGEIHFIEYNAYDPGTFDTCLFEDSDEIDNLKCIEFRWRDTDNKVIVHKLL